MKQENSKRIFIVDDDPFWTAMLLQMLTNQGYTDIHSFSNGPDCIKNLHLKPNLIFLDHVMDNMDGLAVLEKIKQINSDIVVIFCTEHKDLSVAVRAMKNGSSDYLLKTASMADELSNILNNLEVKQPISDKVF